MDAVEFIKERERMCNYQHHTPGRYGCNDCTVTRFCKFEEGKNCLIQCEQFESEMPRLFVDIVKEWSESHMDSNVLNIKNFVKEVGENAVAHGWWEQERNFGELIALCHSELSEALEESRKGKKPTETYYKRSCNSFSDLPDKPEGIPSELADVIIRIFDMCHHYGIDIEKALIEKHEYNKTRPYKHGKQF